MIGRIIGPTILLAIVTGCNVQIAAGPGVQGSGEVTARERPVSEFRRIQVSGSAEVAIKIADETTLTVEIDDNLHDLIKTEVRDDTLVIGQLGRYHSQSGLKVRLTTPTLDHVQLSGAGKITASGIDGDTFGVEVSGAAKVTAAGQVKNVTVSVSGSGDVEFSKLVAENVRIAISGAGSGKVHATQSLDVQISGAGSVRYQGQPGRVKKQISGAGSVKPL